MINLPNIEASKFRKGEYIGYANGVWRITRTNSSYGNWCARYQGDDRRPLLFAFRLLDLSKQLKEVK